MFLCCRFAPLDRQPAETDALAPAADHAMRITPIDTTIRIALRFEVSQFTACSYVPGWSVRSFCHTLDGPRPVSVLALHEPKAADSAHSPMEPSTCAGPPSLFRVVS
jgi:hypothetical protein